jgi:hypothetical protein
MTIIQQSPYLREQRNFPTSDLKTLSKECDLGWIDIASKVNARTIGLFAINFQIVTGESWFLKGSSQRQQTLRQVYLFTAVGNIPHGINFVEVSMFTKSQGSYTDGTNYYGVIYASTVPIAGQVTFYITPTNIVVQAGAGAPAIVSGMIILEWLSQF